MDYLEEALEELAEMDNILPPKFQTISKESIFTNARLQITFWRIKIMSKKRKTFSAEFKSKVVLEMLTTEQTVAQIASKYEISAKSLIDWKKQFLDNASLAFDISGTTKTYKERIDELETENDSLAKKLGRTTVERDFLEKKLEGSVSLNSRKDMVETEHELSILRQCEMLHIPRSSFYYESKPISDYGFALRVRIDKIFTEISSSYGYRMIHKQLIEDGFSVGVNKVARLMSDMGLEAIHPKKRRQSFDKGAPECNKHPYLLDAYKNEEGQIVVRAPNEVWSSDITYIPIRGGHMYLAAVIDWHSKAITAYKISNTMDTTLVTDVLKEAIDKYGAPKILNSDQGSQYRSREHIRILEENGIRISMNGKGRSIDNIAIERFFRTLKYDEIYLNEYKDAKELKRGVGRFIEFYNFKRFHSAVGYRKPMNVYLEGIKKEVEKVA